MRVSKNWRGSDKRGRDPMCDATLGSVAASWPGPGRTGYSLRFSRPAADGEGTEQLTVEITLEEWRRLKATVAGHEAEHPDLRDPAEAAP